jgi:hypothetical protein
VIRNNAEALEALDRYIEAAARAVLTGTWARAFLQEGGTPTWDAVKDVSRGADALRELAFDVSQLEIRYERVTP